MTDSIGRLSVWKLLGVSCAVTLGVWLLFSWPLPRHVGSGIPAAAHREPADIQRMAPGDHLQFMYYCWLAGDMLAGKTPLFYNLYEFNTGNDRERFDPYAYYLPFSLIYAGGAWLGGRAFGWNLAGFVALWLTYLLTWLLARRWTRNEWVAVIAALPGIILPFRWINLFGGSPAGLAMTWIPAILLGVDLAVREDRVKGGILAGTALLFASWGDSHVFFFGALAVPVWCIAAFAGRANFQWGRAASYRRLAVALLPIGVFAAVALLFPVLMNGLYRAVTGAAPVAHAIGPRTLREVLIFSPDWRGLIGTSALGMADQIYIGIIVVILLLAGGIQLLWPLKRDRATSGAAPALNPRPVREWPALVLIGLAMLVIMILALGPRGPGAGLFFEFCRAAIPPYGLIRQSAKIFCLMPSFLAVAAAITLTALAKLRPSRAWAILLPAVLAGLLLWDYAPHCNPSISLLEKKQAAYAAAAADAAAAQVDPRALVIPLWPGDSHYASIYQHFASLYRIRMVNGYNPFIKQGYFENVFRRFESVNQGGLDGDQAAGLRGMGVRYILVHENLFPEKVSPFPVTATLRRFLSHPQLELLCQDGSIWAFKILDAPRRETAPMPGGDILFPARRFEMEKVIAERRFGVVKDPAAGGRGYAALAGTNAGLRTNPIRVAAASNLYWLVRARGSGTLEGEVKIDASVTPVPAIPVQACDWIWLTVPVPAFRGFVALALELKLTAGAVDLDVGLLTAGPWQPPAAGESVTLPAALFFHAGHADLASGSVVFRRDYDQQGIVFYGPKLPLPKGDYEINIAFASPAAPGTELAIVNLEQSEATGAGIALPIRAGQPARGSWQQHENLPFNMAVVYNAKDDLAIRQITITRAK